MLKILCFTPVLIFIFLAGEAVSLSTDVTIYWSDEGIPYIISDSSSPDADKALLFGQGYAMAKCFPLLLKRVYAEFMGYSARYLTPDQAGADSEEMLLKRDILMKTLWIPTVAREVWNEMEGDTQGVLTAFADGINYYYDTNWRALRNAYSSHPETGWFADDGVSKGPLQFLFERRVKPYEIMASWWAYKYFVYWSGEKNRLNGYLAALGVTKLYDPLGTVPQSETNDSYIKDLEYHWSQGMTIDGSRVDGSDYPLLYTSPGLNFGKPVLNTFYCGLEGGEIHARGASLVGHPFVIVGLINTGTESNEDAIAVAQMNGSNSADRWDTYRVEASVTQKHYKFNGTYLFFEYPPDSGDDSYAVYDKDYDSYDQAIPAEALESLKHCCDVRTMCKKTVQGPLVPKNIIVDLNAAEQVQIKYRTKIEGIPYVFPIRSLATAAVNVPEFTGARRLSPMTHFYHALLADNMTELLGSRPVDPGHPITGVMTEQMTRGGHMMVATNNLAEGNRIAYIQFTPCPVREETYLNGEKIDWSGIIEDSTSRTLWKTLHEIEDLPQARDDNEDEQGYFFNSNGGCGSVYAPFIDELPNRPDYLWLGDGIQRWKESRIKEIMDEEEAVAPYNVDYAQLTIEEMLSMTLDKHGIEVRLSLAPMQNAIMDNPTGIKDEMIDFMTTDDSYIDPDTGMKGLGLDQVVAEAILDDPYLLDLLTSPDKIPAWAETAGYTKQHWVKRSYPNNPTHDYCACVWAHWYAHYNQNYWHSFRYPADYERGIMNEVGDDFVDDGMFNYASEAAVALNTFYNAMVWADAQSGLYWGKIHKIYREIDPDLDPVGFEISGGMGTIRAVNENFDVSKDEFTIGHGGPCPMVVQFGASTNDIHLYYIKPIDQFRDPYWSECSTVLTDNFSHVDDEPIPASHKELYIDLTGIENFADCTVDDVINEHFSYSPPYRGR